MILSQLLLLFFTFPAAVFADVEFTIPEAGSTVKVGDVVTSHWKENGNHPTILELIQYDLYLCVAAGDTSDSYDEVELLIQDGVFERGNSVSFKVDSESVGNDADAYFLKMVSSGPSTSVINFSDRFTLVNTTHHEREQFRQRRQNVGAYTIPYDLQIGVERYAPMAKMPGTTITAKTASARYPTSAYTIATTYLPVPTVKTTLSAINTHTASSIENTAVPASQPTIDARMERFLERWKD